jgi:hypothetical protein
MPELGTSGSVRGVCSNAHPYRDKHPRCPMQRILAHPLSQPHRETSSEPKLVKPDIARPEPEFGIAGTKNLLTWVRSA